jgi:hypothetical protein
MTAALVIWRRDDARFVRGVRLTLWITLAIAPVYAYFYVNMQLETIGNIRAVSAPS